MKGFDESEFQRMLKHSDLNWTEDNSWFNFGMQAFGSLKIQEKFMG